MYISFADRGGSPRRRGAGATRVSSVVVTLGVVSLLTDISSESVAAILPLYLTTVIGLSPIAYGVIDGLYQGVSAIVRIFGGWAADRTERPKWVAVFGYGISALARIGFLLATGFSAIVAIVTVDRLGKGLRTAPRDAMITAASVPENLGRSFGVHRMLDTVGAAVGPLLAFLILLVLPTGFTTVFVLSLGCALLGLVVLGLLVPGRTGAAVPPAVGTTPVRPAFSWRALADPGLRRVLVVAGLCGLFTVGDGFVYLALQARTDFAATWFPLLYVGTNVVFLALAIPLGRLADRWGRARVFVAGHAALVAAYLCAAVPIGTLLPTLVCLVLLGVFYAATDGVLAALAAQFAPAGSTATGLAGAQTVVALARFLASTVFGVLWYSVGSTVALLGFAAALLLMLPVAAFLLRTRSSPGHR
ncbi:MFS transporter [Cryobacterium arcticum]|uniref:MFS transporter n=1 Tax=Cryobacterium arcticum TaxID=670052 RepID=A0A317ZLH4_9MICO|nr:MFS transporter [Cryobacterium arcticum]PXA65730.1 MFS transporter [Cryobacterium arcticum]